VYDNDPEASDGGDDDPEEPPAPAAAAGGQPLPHVRKKSTTWTLMKVQSRLFYERLCSTSDDARVEIMVVKEELWTLRLEEILLARLNGGRVQFPTFDSDDEAED